MLSRETAYDCFSSILFEGKSNPKYEQTGLSPALSGNSYLITGCRQKEKLSQSMKLGKA
jgi:hypothetical protein